MANTSKFVITGKLDLSTTQAKKELRALARELRQIKGLYNSSVVTSENKSAVIASGNQQALKQAKETVDVFNKEAEAMASYSTQVDKNNAKIRQQKQLYDALIKEMREYNALLGVEGSDKMNMYELSRAYTSMGEDFNLSSSLEKQSAAAKKARANLESYMTALSKEEKEALAAAKAQDKLNRAFAKSHTSKTNFPGFVPANIGFQDTIPQYAKALKQYTGATSSAVAQTNRLNNSFSRFNGSLLGSIRRIGLSLSMYHAMSTVMQTLGETTRQAITLSAELDQVSAGLKQLDETSSVSLSNMAAQMEAASMGTLNLIDSMKDVNKGYMLGGDNLIKNLPQLFDIARVSARSLGMDAQKAIELMETGIGRLSARQLEEIGITVDTRGEYKRLAAEIGKTSSELSKQEQIQAMVNGIVDRYGDIAESSGAKERTYGEDIQYVRKSWEDFLSTLSQKGGVIDKTTVSLGNLLEAWTKYRRATQAVDQAKSDLMPQGQMDNDLRAFAKAAGLTDKEYYALRDTMYDYQAAMRDVMVYTHKHNLGLEATRKRMALVDSQYKDFLITIGRVDIVENAMSEMRPDFRFPIGGVALEDLFGPMTQDSSINRDLESKFQIQVETAINSAFQNAKIDKKQYLSLLQQLNDIPTIYAGDKSKGQQFADYVEAYGAITQEVERLTKAKIELNASGWFNPTKEFQDANKELSDYQTKLDNLKLPQGLFKFNGFGASFSKAKSSLEGILSSSVPVEEKVKAIKGFLDLWTPAINNASGAMNALMSIANGVNGSIDSALAGIATKVSKDQFMTYYDQAEMIKKENADIALSAENVGEVMFETANNADPFLQTLKDISTEAPNATKSLTDLANKIQDDVVSAMTAGMEVKPWDFLNGYQDASFEIVRRLQDVANKGSSSEFFKKMVWDGTIPQDIVAQGEQAIKAYSQKLVAEGKNLEHPEWLDTDALIREVKQQLEAKAKREETIKLGVDAVMAAGLYASQGDAEKAVKKALGVPSAGAYIDGVQQGLKDDNVGLKTAQTFLGQISDNEKEFKKVGKSMAQKMWAGLEDWIKDQSLTIPTTLAGCNASITEDGALP